MKYYFHNDKMLIQHVSETKRALEKGGGITYRRTKITLSNAIGKAVICKADKICIGIVYKVKMPDFLMKGNTLLKRIMMMIGKDIIRGGIL